MNLEHLSDDEILRGLNRRLSGVEAMIPRPPVWQADRLARQTPTRLIRSRHAVGSFAVLVLIAAVATVAVGLGLSTRNSPAASLAAPSVTIVYRLVPPSGGEVTTEDLDTTATILAGRIASWGAEASDITQIPPDELSVTVSGIGDVDGFRAMLRQTGELEFVLLPRETYGHYDAANGTVVAGPKALPAAGEAVDPSLPAQFTGRDLDKRKTTAEYEAVAGWVVSFAFDATKAGEFETWSGQHVGEYFAIVLDGNAVSVPYINGPIAGSAGQLGGNFTEQDARELAAILQTGSLPMPVEEVSVTEGEGSAAGSQAASSPFSSPAATFPTDIPSDGRRPRVKGAWSRRSRRYRR